MPALQPLLQPRAVVPSKGMSGWLVIATGLAYAWVAVEQWSKGNTSMAIVYSGYAFSNAGLWMAVR